uniref:Uncharacterized protein n=1 Tax=Micrurus surinamensis TaxID=129470 RepID=A0A2D4Q3Z8_MICSU
MEENGNTFFSGTKPAAILPVHLVGEYQNSNLENNLNFAASQCPPNKGNIRLQEALKLGPIGDFLKNRDSKCFMAILGVIKCCHCLLPQSQQKPPIWKNGFVFTTMAII